MSIDSNPDWWRDTVVYQVYPRSFADGNGDGVGDLPGLVARLAHIAELGCGALWISPWYRSPMADAGYDVADYRDIDPIFGTLADADKVIAAAHESGLRVIIDIVPNHCSDQHPWFQAAVAAGPGSPERERFHFRPGSGPDGSEPPNDWPSGFGGPGWTRASSPGGEPEEWYLHLFSPAQPDFNWDHPEVRAEFESILRFWFERGVDGFRIDVGNLLIKQEGLPSRAPLEAAGEPSPYEDRPEVHDVYRGWRRVANSYVGTRIFVGELWVHPTSLKRYLRPDELHTGFNFPYLQAPWQAGPLRSIIDSTLDLHAEVGAPATWVLGNHDVTRVVTRFGRSAEGWTPEGDRDTPVDLELGTRRARAAALLYLALPGCAYVYQGEELGLWEVEDIPAELRQDPTFAQTDGRNPGRDGCRVPLPWEADELWFGFGPTDELTEPWLPQPAAWRDQAADVQSSDSASVFSLYRDALRTRRTLSSGGRSSALTWVEAPEDVLHFERGDGFACIVNFGPADVPLPEGAAIVLASAPIVDGLLPTDTAAWLRRNS